MIANVETQLDALARTDVAATLVDFSLEDGALQTTRIEDAPATDYRVAIYGPAEGPLIGTAGGRGVDPVYPEAISLERAQIDQLQPFSLYSEDGEYEFRATVALQELPGAGVFYTQLVALPLASTYQVVAQYIGIYTILAVIILIASAFLTRWLVTLTFRSLGQVESTATAISAGDFSQRLTDIEPMTTEVGRLKSAINTMLGRVDAALSQRDASVRQMRRFIGDASHELRTPLVTVRGYAELYRMGAISGDEDVAQAMERIEKEAMRMGVLVEDLLALARLDERRDVVIAPVDLRPIARDAALDVRATSPLRQVVVIDTTSGPAAPPPSTDDPAPTAPAKTKRRPAPATAAIPRVAANPLSLLRRRPRPGVGALEQVDESALPVETVPVTVVARPAPIVLGDENRIRQVVTNLLGNARRFTAEDSPIDLRVGVDTEAGMGWIEVADHGEGIPEQIRDKIFQRFWRADTSRARETGGAGLGLSIVASIVEALHGTVSVEETPGGGATFHVAFPLAAPRDAAEHLLIETQPLERLVLPAD
ncbi:sensor histidine kinase [Microbacterium lacus]|uniref:histidine kinase n=1 Tax=Microbacterium lacus TaxID=415217 RepID=A0ABN2H0M2_9MICO